MNEKKKDRTRVVKSAAEIAAERVEAIVSEGPVDEPVEPGGGDQPAEGEEPSEAEGPATLEQFTEEQLTAETGEEPKPEPPLAYPLRLLIGFRGPDSIRFQILHRDRGMSASHLILLGEYLTMMGKQEQMMTWQQKAMDAQQVQRMVAGGLDQLPQ